MRTTYAFVRWLGLIGIVLATQACTSVPFQEFFSTSKNEGSKPAASAKKFEPKQSVPNLKSGECWVQTTILPRGTSTPLEIVTRDAVNEVQVSPATIKPEQRTRIIRQGTQSYRVEPPVFKKVTEHVLVREEVHRTIVEPATFETREEKVQVESAHNILVPCPAAGKSALKAQPGQSLCVKTLPARYKTIKRKILLTPATTREEVEPAVYTDLPQWIVETPARTIPIDIPEKTTPITVQAVASPERIDEKQLPPTIISINSIQYEGVPVPTWSQAPCATDVTAEMVKRLQTALRIAGYRPGAIDGKLGRNTLHAMQLYQGEHGLASGALTLETLQHLGLLDGHNSSQ